MTTWEPDTCNCIIEYDGNYQNAQFKQQCATHISPSETLTHCQAMNRKYGPNPTVQELQQLGKDKAAEKAKPQFQKT